MIFLKRRALMTRASFNYKTVSGIGSAVLENCVETKFKRLSLLGNSKQTSTKGINLIPFNVGEKIVSLDEKCEAIFEKDGVDITIKAGAVNDVKSDIYFIGNGNGLGGDESAYELFQEGDYTFINNTNNQLYLFVIAWRNGEKKTLISGSRVILNNFTINKNDKVRIFLRPSNTSQTYFLEKASVMLCKHTDTNLPYEPYTGGKPSPSIEYQQEIVNAGESGQIEVQVTGKNLLEGLEFGSIDNQGNIIQSTTAYVNINKFIEVKEGKHVINSRDGKRFLCAIFLYDKDKQFIRLDQSGDCVVRKGEKYINITSAKLLVDGVDKTQIELADKSINPTAYKPYKGLQKVQFQLDEPLRGIGEYKDVITKDGIVRKIKEIVLDENTGFTNHLGGIQNKTICFATHILKDATKISALNNAMSDKIEKVTYVDGQDKECFTLFNKRIYIKLSRERNIDTVEKLKEWLKQNPIKIQYLLQEPVLETFENRLDSLHTNDGTTIITVDSGEVETGIEVEYAIKN